MSLKLVFAGTPDFASEILTALLASEHKILGVYTQPDRPAGRGRKLQASAVKAAALSRHIPVYQPATLKTEAEHTRLRSLAPDLLIVVAYGLILPAAVLAIPRYGCINIHASLLPRWRGAAPIQHALLAGDTETGVSIMQMDAGLDTGPVFSRHPCCITPNETSHTLHAKLAKLGAQALLETLAALDKGTLAAAHPQDSASDPITYASKISKIDAKIHWYESAVVIDRKIRAFNPWPVAFTAYGDQTMRIWAARLTNTVSNAAPGTIIKIGADDIEVATGEGVLQLLTVQMPGGKPLPVREMLKANRELLQVNGAVFT